MPDITLMSPFDGWLCPLDDVPDPVFAGRLLGDGLAIDPLADTLHAPADGEVVAIHEARHAVTLRLAPGIELLIHVGLETVALEGDGFIALARVGDRVAAGTPLLRVALDRVARRSRSLVTPMVITEAAGLTWQAHRTTGTVRQGEPLGVLRAGTVAAPAAQATFTPTARHPVRVPLAHGLHARPSARLAERARDFDAQVRVALDGREAALASPSAMLRLGVRHGDTITLLAAGPQAEAALAALGAMIAEGMGETAPFADTPPPPPAARPDGVMTGVTAAPGLAVGTAWRPARAEPEIAPTAADPAAETARLNAALAALDATLAAEARHGSQAQQAILTAHRSFLADPELIDAAQAQIAQGTSAALGWRRALQAEAQALAGLSDPRLAERAADLLDLEWRLQWQLAGREPPAQDPPEGAILIADDLMPSQVAALDIARVIGLATARGGPTSHVAIIAASRGLPALVALGDGVLALAEGTPLVLDATAGRLDVSPSSDRLDAARAEREARARRRAAAQAAAALEGRTRDGTQIEVFANLGKLADAAPAIEQGAEGCGLLRTEFLFLDRHAAPSEDEQAAEYAAIARALEGRPLIVRLLDIGGDKPAPYLPIGPEDNPALGLRGIRVALARREVLTTQLRAILRADGDLRVMVPMIARVAELRAVREALAAEAVALGRPMPPLGVMVETPAAAVMADALAAECDFLSIGTNDLGQYTLAMDRTNPAVASGIDALDPAVLRLVGQTCAGAATQDTWVGVCGGLASDPLVVPILIGLGVTELSVAPAMVAEIKALVRALDMDQCRTLARAACAAPTAEMARALSLAFFQETGL
jgi:multiphosphoryl transfer protein